MSNFFQKIWPVTQKMLPTPGLSCKRFNFLLSKHIHITCKIFVLLVVFNDDSHKNHEHIAKLLKDKYFVLFYRSRFLKIVDIVNLGHRWRVIISTNYTKIVFLINYLEQGYPNSST